MVKKCSTLCSNDQRFIRKRYKYYLQNPYFNKDEGCEEQSVKDTGRDGEDVFNPETPTHEVDDKGYSKQPPFNVGVNHDPWLDFHQSKNHFYSSSDDSDDEASKQNIKVSIKPLSNTDVKSASVHEPFGVLELLPPPSPSVPKKPRTTTYFDGQLLKALPKPSSRMSKTSTSALSKPKGTPSSALGSSPKETNSDIHG